jgi:hypothetical protein
LTAPLGDIGSQRGLLLEEFDGAIKVDAQTD